MKKSEQQSMVATLKRIDNLVDKVEDWSRLPVEPLVSVYMITYNHEKFIAQALDGILMQEVDFPYEIVIGEDKSTDRTRAVVCEYQRRHPDKIRLHLSRENLFRQKLAGLGPLAACRGKYIAMCEGDDYWTDPQKLQKQVAVLEAEPELSACFTNAAVENENGDAQPSVWLGAGAPFSFGLKPDKSLLSQADMIRRHSIPTCTLVMRAVHVRDLPAWTQRVPTGDWALAMVLTEHGPVRFLDELTAVYRRHSQGIWTVLGTDQRLAHFALRMKIYLPYAPTSQRPLLKEQLNEALGYLRRHAIGKMAAQLEAGQSRKPTATHVWVNLFGRMGYRSLSREAWERYFQAAYFKQDRPAARTRLFNLLIRHPSWLFRRGSLGQIVRTLAGRLG